MTGLGKLAALAALGLVAYNVYGDKKPAEEKKAAPPSPPPPPASNVEVRKVEGEDFSAPFFKDQVKKDILIQSLVSATYKVADSFPTDYDSVARAVPQDNPPKGDRLFDWMVDEINKPGPVAGTVVGIYIMGDAKRGGDWTGTAPVDLYAVYTASVTAAVSKGLAIILEPQEISDIYAGADSGYSSEDIIKEWKLDQ